eukprot:705903_1
MACLLCLLLPIAFALSFTSTFLAVYYLSVIQDKLFDYKTPIVCEMGAKKPRPYRAFAIGLAISSSLLIVLFVMQYIKRNECDAHQDTELIVYNTLALITGILLCVSMIGMGVFDLYKYKTLHMSFTSSSLGCANTHMIFTTLYTANAIHNDCVNQFLYQNMNHMIVTRWILLIIIIVLNCAVSIAWLYAIHKQSRQSDDAKETEQNDDQTRQLVKCLLTFAAIGEYIYFFGFVVFVLTLIPTNLL